MANADSPRGLSPAKYLGGAAYSGATNRYFVPETDSTPIFIGGLVKLAGSADADGVATVTGNVSAGDKVVGVVTSVEVETRDSTIHRVASTARYVNVADDPNLLFEVQEDSIGGALAANMTGRVASLAGFKTGDETTGMSSIEIDSSTAVASGGGALDVLILCASQAIDNEIGVNANWLVRLNQHAFVNANVGS